MSRAEQIATIRDFAPRLRRLVAGLTDEQLTTPYNAPEWTVAQNVHHLADSHMNSYIRFVLILTEDHPTLRPYDQNTAAELPNASDANIEDSLRLLEGLHARWARMMDAITDWDAAGYHPELKRDVSLDYMADYYSGHCEAHLRQIQDVLDKMP